MVESLEGKQHIPQAEVLKFAVITERRTLRWNVMRSALELSCVVVNPKWSDEQALRHPRAVAVTTRSYKEGEVRIDGDIHPLKTAPEKVSTTYKYFQGVRVVPVSEIPYKEYYGDPGNAQHAILIPQTPNPDCLPKIFYLTPQDKVVDTDNGTQIYPQQQ